MIIEFLMAAPTGGTVAPPTGVYTTSRSGYVQVRWTASSPALVAEVYRDGSYLSTVAAGTYTYSDYAASAPAEHIYKVRHKSGANYSVFLNSEWGSIVPPSLNLGYPYVTDNDVSLSWSGGPFHTVSEVRVYRDSSLIATLSGFATSYLDNNRPNGTYAYVVKTYNGATESAASTSRNAVVDYNPPLSAPTGFSATTTYSDMISLSWANGDATASTEIYRGTLPNPTTKIITALPGKTSADSGSLIGGTHYYYRIRHVKGASISSYVSDDATTTTSSISAFGLMASTNTSKVTLTWTLTNPPYSPRMDIGSWSDTLGYETASARMNVGSSPVEVVYYNDSAIVYKGYGESTTGTLTYIKLWNGSGHLLDTKSNLTNDFSVSSLV